MEVTIFKKKKSRKLQEMIEIIEKKYPNSIKRVNNRKIFFENQNRAIRALFNSEVLDFLENNPELKTQIWKDEKAIRYRDHTVDSFSSG
jgi:thiol-disulfide isomerase/thioredoxin